MFSFMITACKSVRHKIKRHVNSSATVRVSPRSPAGTGRGDTRGRESAPSHSRAGDRAHRRRPAHTPRPRTAGTARTARYTGISRSVGTAGYTDINYTDQLVPLVLPGTQTKISRAASAVQRKKAEKGLRWLYSTARCQIQRKTGIFETSIYSVRSPVHRSELFK